MISRLRLSLTSSAIRRLHTATVQRGDTGTLVTQSNEYLLTQSGISLEINQPIQNLIELLVTQDGLHLATQSGDVLQRNQL